ncbi:MAG: DUF255 domain-containing protein [Lentisphaerae bacterium]|nr:DUF255 domain-containing protein [Lentisphaerota bacterium]
MKKTVLGLLIFAVFAVFAADEPQVVCEDGICRIVESPGPAEPGKESVSAGGPAVKEEKFRKLLGAVDKEEFLAFLKGEPAGKSQTGFWGMLLVALLGGLALNLTPCVLPMLPINLAVIGASGGKKGFRQGLLYGCGMAAAYGIVGVLAAFAGVSFGTLNSSPLFNFIIALIFLSMSLAMAGVFNIDAASKLRINPKNLPFSEGFTALFMGGVSALLAGACVAPVVISVLVFAAETVGQGNWYGALIPFVLGIGMALPWPLAGAGWSVLPKPGRFMVVLKYVFALLIFGAAVHYAFQGIKLLPDDREEIMTDGFAALRQAQIEAQKNGKPVLIKFTASWCGNCKDMDRRVLRDNEVAEYIRKKFNMVTFPAENVNDPAIKAVLDKYGLAGLPAFVILEK